jgi:tRNA threonylcarbamoyladenosine biosynthesis protein TsaE
MGQREISGLFVYSRTMIHTSKSTEETKAIAKQFIQGLKASKERAVVIALVGNLGAGKTAFSQAVGEELGVKDAIQSPTFLIEKIYELSKCEWQHLVHIDAYRLELSSELVVLGWEAIVRRPENLIIVEWADKIEDILPEGTIRVTMKHIDENTREIEIQ